VLGAEKRAGGVLTDPRVVLDALTTAVEDETVGRAEVYRWRPAGPVGDAPSVWHGRTNVGPGGATATRPIRTRAS